MKINRSNKDVDVLFDTFEGKILGSQYRIEEYFDAGTIGKVYKVIDLHATEERPLIVKIQRTSKMFCQEVKTLRKLQKVGQVCQSEDAQANGRTAEIVHWGSFLFIDSKKNRDICQSKDNFPLKIDVQNFDFNKKNSTAFSYIIMPRYGISLQEFLN